ncbi:CHRD domain-containing protein [Hymenobacter arcticus]
MKNLFFAALATLALASACKKDDNSTPAMKQVSATLSPANEIPAVKTAPAAAGTMTGTYDPTTKVLTYAVTFSGLTGNATAAHLHFGDTKHTTAAPTVPFAGVPAATSGTFNGTATLTPAQADSLVVGKLYANVHTPNNSGGEIRANLVVK